MTNGDKNKSVDASAGVPSPTANTRSGGSDPENNDNNNAPNPDNQNNGNGTADTPIISPNIQAIIFAGLAVFGTAILLYGLIGENQVLDRLSNIEHARGLITFILTVGTMSIAILVTIGALMGRDKEAKDRFYRAKEILTILIGVLGTIVGFYFGSQENASQQADLNVAAPILSPYNVVPGQNLTLTSLVSGGSPPYRYEISFKDDLIERREGYVNEKGWINEEITAPKADKKQAIQYTLKIIDAEKKTATYISDKDKNIIVATK